MNCEPAESGRLNLPKGVAEKSDRKGWRWWRTGTWDRGQGTGWRGALACGALGGVGQGGHRAPRHRGQGGVAPWLPSVAWRPSHGRPPFTWLVTDPSDVASDAASHGP